MVSYCYRMVVVAIENSLTSDLSIPIVVIDYRVLITEQDQTGLVSGRMMVTGATQQALPETRWQHRHQGVRLDGRPVILVSMASGECPIPTHGRISMLPLKRGMLNYR